MFANSGHKDEMPLPTGYVCKYLSKKEIDYISGHAWYTRNIEVKSVHYLLVWLKIAQIVSNRMLLGEDVTEIWEQEENWTYNSQSAL